MVTPTPMATIIDASFVDYLILVIYFAFVLGIGFLAKSQVSESLDFFLSGRSLPAWVTGSAFISANLGAVEIMGMSASGADFGIATVHYFWIGAIPAMLFLGVVMMPFYYGSKVRSVPEYMLRRFGPGAHLVNAISFAVAQLLIAGINLYLLSSILHALLGWPLLVALVVAAVIVLSYITLGGLSAAIYNEVLQFFVIVASLLPLTLIGLHRVGGWGGLTDKITEAADAGHGPPAEQQLNSWPGQALSGLDSPFWSVVGIVFGLGFVLSFGYWTTNFVEVQRAMASESMSAARRTPIIGAFPKMFVPFITIIPGMIAAVLVVEIADLKAGEAPPGGASGEGVAFNDSLLYLMRDLLPNGLLGLAITGLLAAFMAGMAANISAFNTVFSYDLWADYIVKDQARRLLPAGRPDRHGRGHGDRDLHRDAGVQLLQHHGLPPGAVRLLQRAPVRDVHPGHVLETDDGHRGLGRAGGRHAFGSPGRLPHRGCVRQLEHRRDPARGSGGGVPRGFDRVRGRHRAERGRVARDAAEARRTASWPGVLGDTQGGTHRPERSGLSLVSPHAAAGGRRPGHGHRPERDLLGGLR